MGAWFEDWFDSKYYHILYQHRDESEANAFIKQLLTFLALPKGSAVLDLACGKGRHSIQIHQYGYQVWGVDLSKESIKSASLHAQKDLRFEVHDMREPFAHEAFDMVCNLFTSFGYFENEGDDMRTLEAVHSSLKPSGIFVLDFFNAYKVLNDMKAYEIKRIQDIDFHIKKTLLNGHILKTIEFDAEGVSWHFEEKVKAYSPSDLQLLLQQSGYDIKAHFGSYRLSAFDPILSERSIWIATKSKFK